MTHEYNANSDYGDAENSAMRPPPNWRADLQDKIDSPKDTGEFQTDTDESDKPETD